MSYTSKTNIPQYEPTGNIVDLKDAINLKKYNKLIQKINESNISEKEKDFLKFAATRHIVFKYDKIADYYSNASKEMQELMEDSALVIIDINDAISKGYTKISEEIKKIISRREKNEK